MKKIIILLSLFLLCLTTVSAANFDFELVSVRDEVNLGETARFLVRVSSNLSTIREFRISSPEVEWSIPSEVIKAYPDTETDYSLTLTPTKHIQPGKIYGVKINFKDAATGNVVHSDIAEVTVKSGIKAVSAYRPSVRADIEMPATIDPSKQINVKIELENQNLLNLSNSTLKVSSTIEEFKTEKQIDLIPLGKKLVEINYNINPLQDPEDYQIKFELLRNGKVLEEEIKNVNIPQSKPDFEIESSEDSFLLKSTMIKNVTSISNVEDSQTIKIPTNIFKSWLTSTNPQAETIKENGERYLAIDINLSPGENQQVRVTTNYRLVVYVLIVLLLVLYVYYKYKSPLTISKNVTTKEKGKEGISDIKVTLELKNNGKKTIKKATVTDYVPNIARVKKEFGEGTLKPDRIFRHKTKGMVLKWDIENIAPGEDRLITYTIKSKLNIVGDFKIPRAKLTFLKKGKEIITYSNKTGVST